MSGVRHGGGTRAASTNALVPTLLGSGERLFDGVGDSLHVLNLVRTVATPKVTHLKFAKR